MVDGLFCTFDQSIDVVDAEIVADAIVLGLLCTLDQSILVVDAETVADAIVDGLFETPFQSALLEVMAELDIVALAILAGLL